MNVADSYSTSSLRSGLKGVLATLRAWRAERRDRRALECLSDEQLKDIGFRRVPTYPPHYERLD